MNNSTNLLERLNTISGASGAKAKQALMTGWNSTAEIDELFQRLLFYAYDSGVRFGISWKSTYTPVTEPAHPDDFDIWVFDSLENLRITPGLKDKEAILDHVLGKLNADGRTLVQRIVQKDLRCGINESTINKVFKGMLSEFGVQLAKPFSARHLTFPAFVEPKLDGLRCIAEVDTSARQVSFFTRSGKAITSLDNFKEELITLACQLVPEGYTECTVAFDGEVTSGAFLESMSAVRKTEKQVEEGTFHIFDALVRGPGHSPIAASDKEVAEQGSQADRRKRLVGAWLKLKSHIPSPNFLKITDCYLVSSEEEIFTIYNRCRDAGLEGVIVKDINAPYVKKRTAAWLKIKAEETLDLSIVGAFEGEGQFAGSLGGLIVSHKGVEVRVGSGFSHDQRTEYWAQIQEDLKHVSAGERGKCQLIDCPAEVQFQEILPSGSLRHPVFVRLRKDKQKCAVGMF